MTQPEALTCPETDRWVRVTTDHSAYLSGFSSAIPRRHTHVGIVTDAAEEKHGFEMTTGQTSGFTLREILMKNVVELEVFEGTYALGGHQAGLAEAETRRKDAERKKTTREKREGLYK
jgi:hypothetical protein